MNDTFFPVRSSQLSPVALKNELVKRYDFEESLSCSFFDSGMNDIYKVKVGQEVYYLRISQTGMHEQIDYEEEVYIINALCDNGICAAAPLRCRDSSFVWGINAPEGRRFAVVFKEAKNTPSGDTVTKVFNLGSMVAKMHTIADQKDFTVSRKPIDLMELSKKPLMMIQQHIAERSEDAKFLSVATEKLCQFLESNIRYEKPYYGFCHGDIHSGNVFFEGDLPQMFDFDCMGYGWRAYDICVFAWNETLGNDKYIESDDWKAFIDGYNSVRKLSDAEKDTITAFAALRQLWIMGLHADVIERNAGCSWYNDEYFNYNIGIFKQWTSRVFSISDVNLE